MLVGEVNFERERWRCPNCGQEPPTGIAAAKTPAVPASIEAKKAEADHVVGETGRKAVQPSAS